MSSLPSLCERAVTMARRAGADAAEAFALSDRSAGVELEKGTVAQAQWQESRGLGLRVVKDQRVGFAYATTQEQLPAAAEAALKASRLGQRLPRFRFPTSRAAPRVGGLWDARVAALEPPRLLDFAQEILDAVVEVRRDLLVVGGGVHTTLAELAIANSEGLARSHRATALSGNASVVQRRDGVSTGFSSAQSPRLNLAWQELGREAAALAVQSAKPKPLAKGGRVPCLIRPESAADLFSTITVPSLYGKPAHRGESYYSGKHGTKVAHRSLTLREDPTLAGGLGSAPFDDEGMPARRHAPLRAGVLRSFLYDTYDGAEAGHASTGNALRAHLFDGRSYKSPPSTSGLQMHWEAPSRSTEKLIASLDHGLLVHDLLGVHTANATSGDFSVSSSVLFRIRKGALEGPVAPLSIAGNLHASLRRGLQLGNDAKALGGAPAWRLPSVLFSDFTITP